TTAAPIQVGTQFYIYNSAGSGVALSYARSSVTARRFAPWTPIAATQTANGYDIAWQNIGTGRYTVWTTDSNGNYTGNLISAVSGSSYALESLESTFNQDLKGDAVIGPTQKLIQINGSTKLTEVGNHHYNLDGSSGSDPILKYKGATVTVGEFGKW